MIEDGRSGQVSDHVESQRLVERRPEETAFVRVTHFPYEDRHRESAWSVPEDEAADRSREPIPFGQAYEVTTWESGEVTDSYGFRRGAKSACEQALHLVEDRRIPIWNVIKRLRPEEVVWEDEGFETVSGRYSFGVRPTVTEGFAEAHIAVDRATGTCSWGPTREDALDNLQRDLDVLDRRRRTGGIVETDGVLGGAPRVDGSRIGVIHVVEKHEMTDSVVETAAGFSGALTVDEVRVALEWADDHPGRLRRLREERELFGEWVVEYWERVELDDELVVHRRPESVDVTFEAFKQRRGRSEGV